MSTYEHKLLSFGLPCWDYAATMDHHSAAGWEPVGGPFPVSVDGRGWIWQAVRREVGASRGPSIDWIPVAERPPTIGKYADGTSVLLLWDGAVISGWPVDTSGGDPGGWSWESSEWGVKLLGVTHWARWQTGGSNP